MTTELVGLVSTVTWESDHAGLTMRGHCETPGHENKALFSRNPDKGG